MLDEDEDEDEHKREHGIAPANTTGGFIDSSGLMAATTESERQQLQGVVTQIAAATAELPARRNRAVAPPRLADGGCGGGGGGVAAGTCLRAHEHDEYLPAPMRCAS